MDILWQLKNKTERSGHIVAAEKTKQKEVDRWEAANNKVERSGHIVAAEKTK